MGSASARSLIAVERKGFARRVDGTPELEEADSSVEVLLGSRSLAVVFVDAPGGAGGATADDDALVKLTLGTWPAGKLPAPGAKSRSVRPGVLPISPRPREPSSDL